MSIEKMGQSSPPSPALPKDLLMVEQAQTAKGHGNAIFVAGVNDLLVADGTAGLDDGSHAAAAGALDVVAEREECVAAQTNAGHLAEPFLLLSFG